MKLQIDRRKIRNANEKRFSLEETQAVKTMSWTTEIQRERFAQNTILTAFQSLNFC